MFSILNKSFLHDRLLAIASYRLMSPWLHSDFTLKISHVGREYAKLKEELDSIMKEVFIHCDYILLHILYFKFIIKLLVK